MALTWSVSRYQTLHTCERRYYFQYITTARVNSRDAILKEIAFLKKLQTIPMWQGEVFHFVVANSIRRLRRGETLLSTTWLSRLKKKLEQEWAFSESKRFRENLKAIAQEGGLALFEHEYNEGLEHKSCAAVIESIETWVQRFVTWAEQTDFKQAVQMARQIWIEPSIFGADAPGFMVNNVQVIAKVDLAFLSRDGKFEIFDWKTGLPPSHNAQQLSQVEFQLGVYQLWAHLNLKYSLDDIQAHLLYLGTDPVQHQTFQMDQNLQEYTLGLIRRSIDRVIYFSKNSEVALSLEDFDFATYPGACQRCSFKRLCQRTVETCLNPKDNDSSLQLCILS